MAGGGGAVSVVCASAWVMAYSSQLSPPPACSFCLAVLASAGALLLCLCPAALPTPPCSACSPSCPSCKIACCACK